MSKNSKKNSSRYIKLATAIGIIQIVLVAISMMFQNYANNKLFSELERIEITMSEKDISRFENLHAYFNISQILSVMVILIAILLLWFNIELLTKFKRDMNRSGKKAGTIDELTGLLNRKYIEKYLPTYIRKYGTGYLYMCDMDNFKTVNDTLGHGVGDEVLKDFADVLRKTLREEDRICRLGGDEFMLYIPGIDEQVANTVYTRLKAALIKKLEGTPKSIVTLSCGATPINNTLDFDGNYKRADQALYYVKESGKDNFCILR